MKSIAVLAAVLLSTTVFAKETKFENYNCKFTNAEIQTGLENHINVFIKFSDSNLNVKANSLKAEDSTLPQYYLNSQPNDFAKKISFEISSGEHLSLKTNVVAPETIQHSLNDYILNQGILTTFGTFGAIESQVCAAITQNSKTTKFVNTDTKVILSEVSDYYFRYVSAVGSPIIATKPIPQ